jgi:hypothetical protein
MFNCSRYLVVLTVTSILTLLPIQTVLALSCPPVAALNAYNLEGWRLYSYQGEELTRKEDIKEFGDQVRRFTLAQWDKDVPDGPAQCFYVNELASYLAHPDQRAYPSEAPFWRWESRNRFATCKNTTIENCKFTTAPKT